VFEVDAPATDSHFIIRTIGIFEFFVQTARGWRGLYACAARPVSRYACGGVRPSSQALAYFQET